MLDHVALLVSSIESTLERLAPLGLAAGPIEDFPGEGTREVYLGEAGRPGRLLLMQALGDEGPYARALAKRGPGLHHVAMRVPDLKTFASDLRGWLLHPESLKSQKHTLWLARPGVSALVEVTAGDPPAGEAIVSGVEVPASAETRGLVDALSPELTPVDGPARICVGSTWVSAVD